MTNTITKVLVVNMSKSDRLYRSCRRTVCYSLTVLQCDMKKVFVSLSKFVCESKHFFSILGWGKLFKPKFLMMSNISVISKWALLAKVTVFRPQKKALLVAKSKFLDHFYSLNIPQIWSLWPLFREFITFGRDFGHSSILLIFGLILAIFPL